MTNDDIKNAIITKTITVRLITVESYQALTALGYKVVFLGDKTNARKAGEVH